MSTWSDEKAARGRELLMYAWEIRGAHGAELLGLFRAALDEVRRLRDAKETALTYATNTEQRLAVVQRELDVLKTGARLVGKENLTLQARVAELEAALVGYGVHRGTCRLHVTNLPARWGEMLHCDCGLGDALAGERS